MNDIVQDCASQLLLGRSFEELEINQKTDRNAITIIIDILNGVFRVTFGLCFIILGKLSLIISCFGFPRIYKRNLDQGIKLITDEYNKHKNKDELGNSVIDIIIASERKTGKEVSVNWLFYTMAMFLFAGSDTTAGTILAVFSRLAENDNIQQILYDELQKSDIKNPQLDTLKSLFGVKYLDAVYKECLRINYIIPQSAERRVIKDFKLGKYQIKKGDNVCIPIHANQWKNIYKCDEFDPDRFMCGRDKRLPRGSYMPFLGGKRGCLGQLIAEMFIKTTVSLFYENFEMQKGQDFKRDTVMDFHLLIDRVDVTIKRRK